VGGVTEGSEGAWGVGLAGEFFVFVDWLLEGEGSSYLVEMVRKMTEERDGRESIFGPSLCRLLASRLRFLQS